MKDPNSNCQLCDRTSVSYVTGLYNKPGDDGNWIMDPLASRRHDLAEEFDDEVDVVVGVGGGD